MPTPTDLVTDLPADFEVFGQAVATSLADLLGGTSGQILAKNSNTDMDFVWIANDQGDITGITASSPLTGGGTSGAVTVGIQDALTTQKGAVQLSDSTSTTSSILAATPTAVKAAYDLADGAITKTTVTTAGDIIYRNATVPVRLGIGTAGQVLRVNSGATAPEWATLAAGGKVLQVVQDVSTTEESTTSTSYVDTALSIAITPSAATSKILVIVNTAVAFSRNNAIEGGMLFNLVRTSTQLGEKKMALEVDTSATENRIVPKMDASIIYLDSPNTTSATTYKVQFKTEFSSSTAYVAPNSGLSSITLIEIGA
jgi:hypothetical protein